MVNVKEMKRFEWLVVPLLLCAGSLAGTATAQAAEVLFKGSGISLPASFYCNGVTLPAGKYDLSASYEPQPNEGTSLKVFHGRKTVCEVKGSSTTATSSMSASKVRLLTRVNDPMQAIQIDLILPAGVRERVTNQVYYLPLPAKH